MAVIGYGTSNVGTLRLWQPEAIVDFDYAALISPRVASVSGT